MMSHDLTDLFKYIQANYNPAWPAFPHWADWTLQAFLVAFCLSVNWWLPGARSKPEPVVESTINEPPVEQVEP
jgi:hypothetical protein